MARILFLAHRIPYPPNKGDKIRSWHFLQYLIKRHKVHLGFFVDDKNDLKHVDFLRANCASLEYSYASPLRQKISSLKGLLTGTSLTENAYPSGSMRKFTTQLIQDRQIDAVFLYSAATHTFLPKTMCDIPIITDFVDVDSAKWEAYAENNTWPLSAIYRREAVKLASFEGLVADRSATTILVSDDEATLMRKRLAVRQDAYTGTTNQTTDAVRPIGIPNGVDSGVFSPGKYPDKPKTGRLIFTGAMDYAPNIEAVVWFADQVFPRLQQDYPEMEFLIAGRPVAPAVQKLDQRAGVNVIGAVDDMAETIANAAIVVAPLLTARGIQNKVLEGMAMAKPVVATTAANEGINAPDRDALWIADNAEAFVDAVKALMDPHAADKLGQSARQFVLENFNWENSCETLNTLLGKVVTPDGEINGGPIDDL